ncbi:HAD family hydrolase [Rhodococcus sp. 15-649-2-2]|uniref:HAD-IIA family hydrolase n=1 Tax=Rhodococcus sp. 15-649-2-2 TaxID=2023140 RepID=UPI000B9BD63F|nr:HAD-IIA family hydrolase [Rhodococcus sp. 15-649-2-2]OZE74167.1 HAD family hydrolase [Rhodococcus sp. 15-649-2-2]
MTLLRDAHDVLLLDLDGTVYAGKDPIPGAVEALSGGSEKQYFVTNNASRAPQDVAEHLRGLGFDTSAEFVVTSSEAAARVLAGKLNAGARVLVVGTDALANEISKVGLEPVRSADDDPVAVVQGHSVDTGWKMLAEAVLAVRAGALWVATNIDATLPTERGLVLGNGSMVAAVRNATDVEPIVAGKPAAPIMHDAIERSGAHSALVVGDRLDTDIAGANEIELPSLLVLTGVSTAAELLRAPQHLRPTHIGPDLGVLNQDESASRVGSKDGWAVGIDGGVLSVRFDRDTAPDVFEGALAVLHVAWSDSEFTEVRFEGTGLGDLRSLLGC